MPQKPATLTYPKTQVSKVNRYSERASYDTTTIHTIINTSLISHVSFVDSDTQFPSSADLPASPPLPTILPMIARMGSFSHPSSDISDPLDLYLHTSFSTRLARLISSSSSSGFPLTVAATKVDGIVLALTPFHHSYNYRSAVIFGNAHLVEDLEEKLFAARLITEGATFVGNWERARKPTEEELKSLALIRVEVVAASAKIRVGESMDDKKDREDEELVKRAWSGVVPVWEAFGSPVESSYNNCAESRKVVPEYIWKGKEEREVREREYAIGVAKKQH